MRQAFTQYKALDFMFEQVKAVALKSDWYKNKPDNR